MEATLGLRELITLITVVGGGYATVRVIETKIARIIKDLEEHQKRIVAIFERLDEVEEGKAVTEMQITTMRQILSPDNLEKRNREAGEMLQRVKHLEQRT